jgi:hypothetical protein
MNSPYFYTFVIIPIWTVLDPLFEHAWSSKMQERFVPILIEIGRLMLEKFFIFLNINTYKIFSPAVAPPNPRGS